MPDRETPWLSVPTWVAVTRSRWPSRTLPAPTPTKTTATTRLWRKPSPPAQLRLKPACRKTVPQANFAVPAIGDIQSVPQRRRADPGRDEPGKGRFCLARKRAGRDDLELAQ